MIIKIGTFNLNNLFSRYNFNGAIDELKSASGALGGLTIRYEFTDPNTYRVRTFKGKLIKAKEPKEVQSIANRINTMDVDVLAVQEVENIDILRRFNKDYLNSRYKYQVLIEGNDPRFIDVAILSKLPIGGVTSFQTAVHPTDTGNPIFGRDMVEVEIWDKNRTQKLLTLFNNHLKSNLVTKDEDPVEGALKANQRRFKQAEVMTSIIDRRMRPDSSYIVVGDFNDTPDSEWLVPFTTSANLALQNALTNPLETRPPVAEEPGFEPTTTAWSYRFKESKKPPKHLLYDQIWISQPLRNKLVSSHIDRRTKHGGDGSDHDAVWIELNL